MKTYPIRMKNDKRFIGVVLGCLVGLLMTFYFKYMGRNVYSDDYLNISQLFYTAFLFTVFQHLPKPILHRRIWQTISVYSFGIYLLHPIIVRDLVWPVWEQFRMHALIETPLIAIISMMICWGILFVLSRSSVTRRVTGL